jgi:hypothetical protein
MCHSWESEILVNPKNSQIPKMSWDEIGRSESKCPCGKGKFVSISEADDWNRSRTRTQICCPTCQKKHEKALAIIHSHEAKGREARKSAEHKARERFLPVFENHFAGLSKKEVWERLHKGSQYPALGTFYSHIRSYGSVAAYLERHFLRELEVYFPAKFKDHQIEAGLLQEKAEAQKAIQARHDWAAYLPIDE